MDSKKKCEHSDMLLPISTISDNSSKYTKHYLSLIQIAINRVPIIGEY